VNTRLVASATLVLVLIGGSLAAVRVTQAPRQNDSHDASDRRKPEVAVAAQSTMDYYRYLRMLGLTEDETKPLILAHLRSRERRRLGNAEFRYWTKEGDTLLLKAVADELAVSDRVRSALSEIYRHSDDDAMFAQLYRPYDERLSFLTSPQQVQLQHGR
jgi:hypothetical protein